MRASTLRLKFIILLALALFSFLLSLKTGKIETSWNQIFDFLTGNTIDETTFTALKMIRLTRAISAFLVGSFLAVSGCILQAILRNPLADSYTLGISGGSSVGAALALFLALSPAYLWLPIFSLIGAFLSVLLVVALTVKSLTVESRTLILIGVMLSLFLGALSVFVVSLLPMEKTQWALGWLMGEFGTPRDDWVKFLAPLCLLPTAFAFTRAKALDILSLGDVRAISLGISPRREKLGFIFVATVLTAFSISISGLIGFIGLVSAHVARRYIKSVLHRYILPTSFLVGGSLLLLSDTLGRAIIGDREIPAGSLSALIGAPILIYLLLEKKNAQNE